MNEEDKIEEGQVDKTDHNKPIEEIYKTNILMK